MRWALVLGGMTTLGMWASFNQTHLEIPSAEARRDSRLQVMKKLEIPLETSLVPGSRSTTKWILQEGFSHPDLDGAWLTATSGRIKFSVAKGQRPERLLLLLVPFVAPSRPSRTLTFETRADNVSITLTGPPEMVEILLDGESSQEIQITCDSVDSPYSLRVGGDQRELCAKLLSLTVLDD